MPKPDQAASDDRRFFRALQWGTYRRSARPLRTTEGEGVVLRENLRNRTWSGGFLPDSLDKFHAPNNIRRLRVLETTLVCRGARCPSDHDRQAVRLPQSFIRAVRHRIHREVNFVAWPPQTPEGRPENSIAIGEWAVRMCA